MGFRVPSFNLSAFVWSRDDVPPGPVVAGTLPPPRIDGLQCQLRAAGKQSTTQDEPHTWSFGPALLCPAGSDIRDWACFDGLAMDKPDLVEVPRESGRYYTVAYVDDVAKGFPNEYRIAYLVKNPYWPIPVP